MTESEDQRKKEYQKKKKKKKKKNLASIAARLPPWVSDIYGPSA